MDFQVTSANGFELVDGSVSIECTLQDNGTDIASDAYTLVYQKQNESTGKYSGVDGITSAGQYQVRAEAVEGKGYTGATGWWGFTVLSSKDLGYASFGLRKRSYAVSESPVELSIYLRDYHDKEIATSDYKLEYQKFNEDKKAFGEDILESVSEIGSYRVRVVPTEGSSYTGATGWQEFSIVAANDLSLASARWSGSGRNQYEYTGEAIVPQLSFWIDGAEIDSSKYTLSYRKRNQQEYTFEGVDSATDVGTYQVCATANEDSGFTGQTGWYQFEIVAKGSLSLATFQMSTNLYTATGSAVVPDVTLTWTDGTTLIAGTDYELKYQRRNDEGGYDEVAEAKEPGEYRVRAVAKDGSDYTGETDLWEFEVVAANDLKQATIQFKDQPYIITGKTFTPSLDLIWTDNSTISTGDYTLEYRKWDAGTNGYSDVSGVTEAGQYQVRAVAKGGTYSGETYWWGFTVYAANDLQLADISLDNWRYIYTDDFTQPVVTVKMGDDTVDAADYDITYQKYEEGTGWGDATDKVDGPGEYLVTATAKDGGSYTGSTSTTFDVFAANDLRLASVSFGDQGDSYVETGEAIKPDVTLTIDGQTVDPSGYTVKYEQYDQSTGQFTEVDDPIKPGEYRMTFTGDGANYIGSTERWFTIVAENDLSRMDFSLNTDRYVATGKTIDLDYTLKDRAGKNIDSAEYELAIYKIDEESGQRARVAAADLKDSGRYEVWAEAKDGGSYIGQTGGWSFTVVAANDLSLASVSLSSYRYTTSGEAVVPEVTVKDGNGKTIDPSAYTLVYGQYNEETEEETVVDSKDLKTPGTYHVYAVAKNGGGFTGQTGWAGFDIVASNDLKLATLELSDSSFDYDGGVHFPTVTVTDSDGSAIDSAQYTISCEKYDEDEDEWNTVADLTAVKDAGEYRVRAAAKAATEGGTCIGETDYECFNIVDTKDIKNGYIDFNQDTYLWTGQPIAPKITLYDYQDEEVPQSDYTLSYVKGADDEGTDTSVDADQLTEPGDYYVTATAKDGSGYTGACTRWFRIAKATDLTAATLTTDAVPDEDDYVYTYTGSTITPKVTLTGLDGKVIDPENYTVSYRRLTSGWGDVSVDPEDILEPGQYYVHATAKDGSGYTGEASTYFSIARPTEEDQANAAAVTELIAQLPATVTTDAEQEQVNKAQSAYDALTSTQKALVSEDSLAKLNKATESAKAYAQKQEKAAKDKAAADATTALIAALPTKVTTDAQQSQVKAAQTAYDALSADQKALVTDATRTLLANAQKAAETYASNVKKAAEVETLIGKLSTNVTTDAQQKAAEAAQAAYDALTSDQKALVSKTAVTKLNQATTSAKTYADKKAADQKAAAEKAAKDKADKAEADTVEALIGKLSTTVTTDDAQKAAEAAQAAYDALSADQKALISSASLLKLSQATFSAKTYAVQQKAAAEKAAADKSAADKVAELIGKLPATITSDAQQTQVEKTQVAYDALTSDQKALISKDTVSKLNDATASAKTYAEQQKAAAEKAAADKTAADKVSALIAVLPYSVTTDAEQGQAEAAQAAYDALTSDQKELVSKVSVTRLNGATASAKTYAQQKKAAADKAKADKKAADKVTKLISALPKKVTAAAQAEQVSDALAAYEDLTYDQEALVKNSAKKALDNAEASLDDYELDVTLRAQTVTVNSGTVTAKSIKAALKKAGSSKSTVRTFVIGAKVKKLPSKAFSGYKKVKTVVVRSKKLTAKSVKNALKGSKVTKVKVKIGNKKTSNQYVKKYQKIFTKTNVGKKVKVTRLK